MSEKAQRRRSASQTNSSSSSGGSRPVLKALSKDIRRFDSPKSSFAQKSNLISVASSLNSFGSGTASAAAAAAANRVQPHRSLAASSTVPTSHSHLSHLLQDANHNALIYPSFSSLLSKKRSVSAAATASFDIVTQHRLLLLKNHPKVFKLHQSQHQQQTAKASDQQPQLQLARSVSAEETKVTPAVARKMEREEESETAQVEEGEEEEGRDETDEAALSDSEPEPE